MRDEKIVAVGTTAELKTEYPDEPTLDASGGVLMPGFVDPHTHLIWAGDRADEFEKKMSGVPYLDILAACGGILSTVRKTRHASMEALIAQSRSRLLRMFVHGTTTAEAKTGYGLQTATELRLLKALLALDDESPLELAFTSSAHMPSRPNTTLGSVMPDTHAAFYFSAVTYTTTGSGDLVLPEDWRLVGGIEALTGILMCGWSTGFFFTILSRIHYAGKLGPREG